ncbi:MAG TPA: PIG-L deacetylase family protein [Acidimicrobiales bacterium]|nr:PIG-L deacetylase family protein [Acidimicrobiales bacterium]
MDEPALEPFPEDWERALAVVAHPDDLEYGAASAIAKWTDAGRWVGYVLATSGEAGIDGLPPAEAGPLREAEEVASAAVVGVDSVEFLGLPDGTLTYGLDLRRELAAAIRRHRPDLVLSVNFRFSWGGPSVNMADHRVLGEALLDAVRDAGNRWVFPDLIEEGLEPWSGVTRAAFNGSPQATHAVDVTGWLDRGIESLAQHAAYLRGLGDGTTRAADVVTPAAEATGARIGVRHAVAFEVLQP